MNTPIHCIDHEAAKNELFKFKLDGELYTAKFFYDADFDGEIFASCNGIATVTDSKGVEHESMCNREDLIDDMDEIIHAINDNLLGGYHFAPFEPLPEPVWPRMIYVARKYTEDGQLTVTVKRRKNGSHDIVGEHHPTHGSTELLGAQTFSGKTDEQCKRCADKVIASYVDFHSPQQSI